MPPSALIDELASAIREERKRRGLTQPQLAVAAGVSERALRQIETGKGTARIDIIARLLDALDLGVEIERNARYSQGLGATGATGPSPHLLGNAGRLQNRRYRR